MTLNTGADIPQVGLGLWKIRTSEQFMTAFQAAIQAGYRHFDTAQAYENEHLVGRAWRESGLPREEFFLTTKLGVQHFVGGSKSLKESLEDLQTEYADLMLLHFPVPLVRRAAWRTLEKHLEQGKAHAIGVSNYTIKHLEKMKRYTDIVPAVNQVELHVFLQQPELIQYCEAEGIVVEAYSPLAHARANDDEVIKQLAEKYSKSYAQIMLRWCIQQNLVVLPKSVTPSRIAENINIFDFALSPDDMTLLKARDRNLRTCWSPVHVP